MGNIYFYYFAMALLFFSIDCLAQLTVQDKQNLQDIHLILFISYVAMTFLLVVPYHVKMVKLKRIIKHKRYSYVVVTVRHNTQRRIFNISQFSKCTDIHFMDNYIRFDNMLHPIEFVFESPNEEWECCNQYNSYADIHQGYYGNTYTVKMNCGLHSDIFKCNTDIFNKNALVSQNFGRVLSIKDMYRFIANNAVLKHFPMSEWNKMIAALSHIETQVKSCRQNLDKYYYPRINASDNRVKAIERKYNLVPILRTKHLIP